jgi:hypothetical protein
VAGSGPAGLGKVRHGPFGAERREQVTKLTEYPFETEALAKGDRIKADIIEQAYSVTRDTGAYQLAALAASEFVRRRFADRGETVMVVQRKFDLVILTDEEAVEHAEQEFWRGIKKAGRIHARSMGIDRANLAPPVAAVHDRQLETRGRVLAATRQAKRMPAPEVRRRSTPLLKKA